ncbi:hypothetical protein L1049_020080 [Liquidambar formosana]|uniref:histidine kinase n=1 Tax=Liquidambar formosana TaxID=63359 RepID=A0AAP0S7U7_LIQFO
MAYCSHSNNDGDQTLAVFCNTSFSSTWYTQRVNRDTGKLYGQPVGSNSLVMVNASWFQEALNDTNGIASLGIGWNKAQDLLFHNTVAMDGRGLITLGFPAKVVVDRFASIDFHGGDFHLTSGNGDVLVQTKLPHTQMLVGSGTVSVQLVRPNGDVGIQVGNISCDSSDGEPRFFDVKIEGMKYMFHCSTLEIAGVPSVYVLAYRGAGLAGLVHKNTKLALMLLVLMFVSIVVSLSIFIFLIARAARREMYLCAALIKQMEATQQAERKSMNKSLAFASASHDVRASLAAITGLIELCQEDARPDSDLASNLVHMNTCTRDLLGILNSVLDTSKIEAGKMQLDEEEFNLAQLLEDVVDMFYPIGIKKGIDIVLDPCDGSIHKLYLVRGDRGKLKQILCNLLSNAVKFTLEGHVSVRAIVKKISFENAIMASNRNVVLKCSSWLCYKNKEGLNDFDALHAVQQNPNYMEFVFEVDDTGKGIPKDRQKLVFENFVQVKETALGQEGCGLGLGIVQSLVRLMGGEIGIVDKEPGERGTCFKFNIFLATSEAMPAVNEEEEDDSQHFGLHLRTSPIPKSEGSHVILLISGDERRRIAKRLIESLGIKATVLKRGKDLFHVLERLKHKLDLFHLSSSGKTDTNLIDRLSISPSHNSSSLGGNDGSLCFNDGNDQTLPHYKKSNSKNSPSFILIVVDVGAGPVPELCFNVANFRKEVPNSLCKVIWLDNPAVRNATHSKHLEEDWPSPPPCDQILSKPFHGSRLYQVLGLLPEFGGSFQCNSAKSIMGTTSQEVLQHSTDPISPNELNDAKAELGTSSSHQNNPLKKIVIHECDEKGNDDKPLSGKKILVVEDQDLLRMVAIATLTKIGADVEFCVNGKEALDRVCKILSNQCKEGQSTVLPYDYIFMDCEMELMNGYEATRAIRKAEKEYGVYIPIIALTAHAMTEEASKTINAGMDFHLTKPLRMDKLLEAIRTIDEKWNTFEVFPK